MRAIAIIVGWIPGTIIRFAFFGPKKDIYGPRLVGPRTDVVVEGFPRSANTYCYYYLQLALPEANFAHHIHSWQQFLLARLLRVPSILIIRDADKAVASLITKDASRSVAFAYLDYAVFNFLSGFLANRVVWFTEAVEPNALAMLAEETGTRIGMCARTVQEEDIRELMERRTDHKNRPTTPLAYENELPAQQRLARGLAVASQKWVQRRYSNGKVYE